MVLEEKKKGGGEKEKKKEKEKTKSIEFYSGRQWIFWQISFFLLRLVSKTYKGGSKAALIEGLSLEA